MVGVLRRVGAVVGDWPSRLVEAAAHHGWGPAAVPVHSVALALPLPLVGPAVAGCPTDVAAVVRRTV